jgi:hypothetical protein
MPGMTPLGIVYPCSGETMTVPAFITYAQTSQAAITALELTALTALYPKAAQERRIFASQNFNAGVSGALTYDTEVYDTDNVYVPPATSFTLPTPGTYYVTVQARNSNQPANFTSLRVAILLNGTEVSVSKADCGNVANTVSDRVNTGVLLGALPAASVLAFNFIYTGGASPMGVDGTATITRVATV